jgi:hypothetical protein
VTDTAMHPRGHEFGQPYDGPCKICLQQFPCDAARARDEIARLTEAVAGLNSALDAETISRDSAETSKEIYRARADAAEAKVAMLTEAAWKFLDAIPGPLGSVTSPAEVERVCFRVVLTSSSAAEYRARIEREAVGAAVERLKAIRQEPQSFREGRRKFWRKHR